MESFSRHFDCYYSMQVRFRVRILILISTIYIGLIARNMNNAWEWFLSRQSAARTNFEQWKLGVFSLYALESRGYFNSGLEYIESYVVLAEQQSRIPYMCGKSSIDSIKYFRPVWLRIFRPFSPPSSSSLPRIGAPRARQIYTAFHLKK